MSTSDIATMLIDQLERLHEELVNRRLLDKNEAGEPLAKETAAIEDLGLNLALVGEDADGAGLGWTDVVGLFEVLGYHASPFLIGENLVANRALYESGCQSGFGTPLACTELLALDVDSATLTGCCTSSYKSSGHLVVEATSAVGRHLCVLALAEAEVEPLITVGRNPWVRYHFRQAKPIKISPTLLEPGTLKCGIALLRSGQIAGALSRILSMSVEYSNTRIQFGRPIGKFQAVQHIIAELAGETAAAKAAVRLGARAMDQNIGWQAIAIAKLRTSQAAGRGAALAHSVHGAIGVTEEHMLHHFTRRLWQWRDEAGTEHEWAEKLGRSILARGGAKFWPDIVDLHGRDDPAVAHEGS